MATATPAAVPALLLLRSFVLLLLLTEKIPKEAFTQKLFHTKTVIYTEKLLHTAGFHAQQTFTRSKLLHTKAPIHTQTLCPAGLPKAMK